jgi:RHS repeat-associated protein
MDSGYNRTFGYDDLNRLVTANSGVSLWGAGGYTYDSMGNMLTATLGTKMRSFTYTATTPLINTVFADGALTSMQYDAAGNELNGPAGASANFISDTRTYSARNLLQQADFTSPTHYCRGPQHGESCTGGWVLQSTSTLWNGYDARGVRVVSMQSSSVGGFPDMKFFFYTPELTQLATFAPNDGIGSDVIWFGGRPVASDSTDGPDPRFTFTDHLGTPIVQTDALANVVWRAEYEPFGNVIAMRAGGANDQRLRFPGQQIAFTNFAGDEENYNIFRWYRSGWGRYTQADPVGLQAGTNLFSYVHDNPINMIDPSGLRAELVCRAVGTGGHPIPGSRHCRLRVTCDQCPGGPPEIDVTVGMENTGNPPYTINEWAYPSGLGAYTETWPVAVEGGNQCNFARCVRAYNRLFSRGYTGSATRFVPAYSIPGPNSNTYAACLIDICGGMGAFPPGAIGSGGYPGTPAWGY